MFLGVREGVLWKQIGGILRTGPELPDLESRNREMLGQSHTHDARVSLVIALYEGIIYLRQAWILAPDIGHCPARNRVMSDEKLLHNGHSCPM